MMSPPNSPLAPVLLTALSALMWGLWWIPIRWIESLGLSGSQAGVLCNLGAVLALGGYMIVARIPPRLGARTLMGAGLIGVGFALYSVAFTLSDVLRVILLFYLAPTWSKIIEWAFLGQRWRATSSLTLVLSLGGAYLVLGGRLSLAGINLGDALALVSGVAWAVGAALVFSGPKSSTSALTLATALWAMLLSLALALIMGEAMPSAAANAPALGAALLVGVVYLVPILAITLWSAQRLPPGLLSFLFTLEIVAGVLAGALLLEEPFGLYQLSGGLLIISAALIEAIVVLRTPAAATMLN